ncbi:MAG: hypothetical protein VB131_02720, partial [Burkholderia gladioli]
QLDHRALFTTQVFVGSHRNTIPLGRYCTSDLRPPFGRPLRLSGFSASNKVVSITSKMIDTTLASIFAGVYDGHAESLTI